MWRRWVDGFWHQIGIHERRVMMIVSCTWRMFAILKNLNCLFLVWCVSRKASLDLATRQECGISASTKPYWHKAGNAAAWTLLAGFHGLKAAPSWKGSLYPPSTASCLEERSSRSAEDAWTGQGTWLYGSVSHDIFTYCGKKIEQLDDGTVQISMKEYHENLKTVAILPHCR